jgi:hypothetical protein
MQLQSHKLLPLFDSPSYSKNLDEKRLTGLAEAVYNLMSDGEWRTVPEIKQAVNRGSETGISATLRGFRKWLGKDGVISRRRGEPKDGVWEYKINQNEKL